MTNQTNIVTVQVLDKSYQIQSNTDDAATLQQAANMLHEKISVMQSSTTTENAERIVIQAALSLTQDFIRCQAHYEKEIEDTNKKLAAIQEKIENALTQTEPVAL